MVISMTQTALTVINNPSASIRACRVESWLGDVLLSDDVPITSGREENDRSARVHERVTLRVPREVDGFSWAPVDNDEHPLAANGQRLRVLLGVGLDGQEVEWIERGEFVIQSSELQGNEVAVEAVGLMALVDEASFVAPYQPNGTFKRSLRALVEPAVTVLFHPDLVDRNVPGGINYDEDRLGAALELLDAWPARAQMQSGGYLYVVPADLAAPFGVVLNDDVLVELTTSSSREGAYTCVVARGTAPDGQPLQGVAYVTDGPLAYLGEFNPLPVPLYFASPLMVSNTACRAAANAIRDRIVRERSRPYVAKVPPMPHLQCGDRTVLTEDEYVVGEATVEALSLPYTPGDGEMSLTLVKL